MCLFPNIFYIRNNDDIPIAVDGLLSIRYDNLFPCQKREENYVNWVEIDVRTNLTSIERKLELKLTYKMFIYRR